MTPATRRNAVNAPSNSPLVYFKVLVSARARYQQGDPPLPAPHQVRRIIYTTNALENPHMRLRKIVKSRGHVLSDDAATKLLYVALRTIIKKWRMPSQMLRDAANQSAITFSVRNAQMVQ